MVDGADARQRSSESRAALDGRTPAGGEGGDGPIAGPDQALVPPLGRTLGDVQADSLSDDVGDRAPLLEGDLATPHAA